MRERKREGEERERGPSERWEGDGERKKNVGSQFSCSKDCREGIEGRSVQV